MTPTQCRMARTALDWSTTDLARAAEVGQATVTRFETDRDARISTVEKLRSALEAAGIAFIAENGGGVGVRFRKPAVKGQIGA
jgi:predicted transcriptional regulator